MASGDSNRKRGFRADGTINTSGLKPHIVYDLYESILGLLFEDTNAPGCVFQDENNGVLWTYGYLKFVQSKTTAIQPRF